MPEDVCKLRAMMPEVYGGAIHGANFTCPKKQVRRRFGLEKIVSSEHRAAIFQHMRRTFMS